MNRVDKKTYSEVNISRLINIIKENAIVTDETALLTSLSHLFHERQKKSSVEIKPASYGLKHFLPSDFIQIRESARSWKEAILIACEPLLKRNIINDSYVNTLVEENDSESIYSFLGKRMAIPHAAPEKGVSADAFAMLIVKKPVTFKNGHKVSIITPLAIYNQNRHLKALMQLSDLAEDEDKISRLLLAEDQDQAWRIINGY